MAASTDPTYPSGRTQLAFTRDLYEGDSGKTLFTLPGGALIIDAKLISWAKSSNANSAFVSVGVLGGSGAEFLPPYDVKNNGAAIGSNPILLTPTFQFMGATGSNNSVGGGAAASRAVGSNGMTVTGTYTVTGGTAGGGPVTVVLEILST